MSAEDALAAALEEYVPSLEELLTEDFGLDEATPLQRAICRIADGRPLGDLRHHPHVVEAIGAMRGPRGVPRTMALLCAIRAAKSMMAGAAAIRCALTCDVSGLAPGEVPRATVLSLRKDTADVIFTHILGALRTSPRLAARVLGEPKAGKVALRHPSGRPVEIVVDAGKRAGGSLVARWMACVIFDEAPRMVGSDEGVVNLDDSRTAVAGRLLPSGCAPEWLIGSPWAPFGPMYEIARDCWKKSSREMVVVRARGDWMNPAWWTPERIAEFRSNPAFKTDFEAEFADPESALIPSADLDACTRAAPLVVPSQRRDGYEYAAEMDPATRTNAWTLVVSKQEGRKSVVVLAREWRPTQTERLSPTQVLTEVRDLLLPYGVTRVGSDQHHFDSLRELAKPLGLTLVDYTAGRESNDVGYVDLGRRMAERLVELPNEPVLLSDLRRLVRKTTANGYHVHLPLTPDGRHCDFAPPVMRIVSRVLTQPKPTDPRTEAQREQDRLLAAAQKRVRAKKKPWYAR